MDDGGAPRILVEDAAVVDVGAYEIIRGSGADRVDFLHRLLTGDVAGIPIGGGSRSLLLNLKGHMVSDIRLFARADEMWMVVAPGQGAPTAAALGGYAVMDDFAAAVVTEQGPLAVHGRDSGGRLAAAGVALPPDFIARPVWSHADVATAEGQAWAVRARASGSDGIWLFAGEAVRGALAQRLAADGVPALAPEVAEALRIESGEPAWGREITPDYFPMEVGLNPAIDYRKGCYLGQEPIVRVRDRGHINWRLVRLRARDAASPVLSPGDALESDAKARAGRVTSAGRLPGGPAVALAVLHVSVPIGTEVRVRHGEVTVRAVALEAPAAP